MKKVLNLLVVALPFLIFAGLFILLKRVFFFHDEWTFLYQIVNSPRQFILSQHNGHFMPIFKIIYFLEYKIFHLNYYPYQIVLLVFHFLNGGLIYLIAWRLTKKRWLAALSFFLFMLNSIYWEILFSSSSALQYILYLNFTAASFLFFLKYQQKEQRKHLFLSGLLALLSTYTLGSGTFFPLLLLMAVIIKGIFLGKAKVIEVVVFWVAGAVSAFTYFRFASAPSASNLDFRQIFVFTFTSVRWLVLGFYTSSPGFVKLFIALMIFISVVIFQSLRDRGKRRMFFRAIGKNKLWLLFSVMHIIYIYFLTAVARYRMDMALAKSSRYTYSTLFFLILINALVLDALFPLLSRKVKTLFFAYAVLLTIGHLYFFRLYYRNWTETISGPNRKVFERITKASSTEELKLITFPSTFHPLYTAKEIYLIYEKTSRK